MVILWDLKGALIVTSDPLFTPPPGTPPPSDSPESHRKD